MSASISRSRNSMPRKRSPLRLRSRCRSIRAADAERDGSFAAGDASAFPRSWTIDALGREVNPLPPYKGKYQALAALEIAASIAERSLGPSRWVAAPTGPKAG
jgi:hypothetical protein